MNHRLSWIALSVVVTLCCTASCAQQERPEPTPATPSTSDATIAVTIAGDGTFSPSTIAPNPGQTVAFFAQEVDAVLCVTPASLFGDERYPIAHGETIDLQVQPEAVHIDFAHVACVGDLEAACGGCRGVEGGGRTGP